MIYQVNSIRKRRFQVTMRAAPHDRGTARFTSPAAGASQLKPHHRQGDGARGDEGLKFADRSVQDISPYLLIDELCSNTVSVFTHGTITTEVLEVLEAVNLLPRLGRYGF
jgi:hypothetical protein